MLREEQLPQQGAAEGSTGIPFDRAALLAPVSEDKPYGEVLDTLPLYDEFRSLVSSSQPPNWGRYLDRAVKLAEASRDLRAWIWVTRAALSAEGMRGLAAGLRLIAEGLERYWDTLPPQHVDEADPRERFMRRLSALTQLGATNFNCSVTQLLQGGRSFVDLRADLDAMVAKALPDAATREAVADARAAIGKIVELFAARFGAGRDPQLGFEVLLEKLKAIEQKFTAPATAPAPGVQPAGKHDSAGNQAAGPIRSRDDVVRSLNEVLEYYESNEPSSPVPLLIQRAKRVVSLSFVEATKELAPSGLKELLAATGSADERK